VLFVHDLPKDALRPKPREANFPNVIASYPTSDPQVPVSALDRRETGYGCIPSKHMYVSQRKAISQVIEIT